MLEDKRITKKLDLQTIDKIKNTFLIDGNVELKRFKNKLKLHIILVNPGIECSTEHIYFKNKL